MQLHDDFVAVRVPATTANLGSGFDCAGMALSLFDDVAVHATTGKTSVTVEGQGVGDVDTGEKNLVVQALRAGLDAVGAPQVGISMHCTNRIPHSRGLGSSASAIVAGLVLARALVGDPDSLTRADIITLATRMEGHPDNVAPAVDGGVTFAWSSADGVGVMSQSVPEFIHPVVFIPDFELSTSVARQALPDSVPRVDAVFNVARVAALTALLSGATPVGVSVHQVLMDATEDRLHQEYRRRTMEPSLALVDWLREAGYAAVVSGAGPTVICLEQVPQDIENQARDAGWDVRSLPVCHSGVEQTRGKLAYSL